MVNYLKSIFSTLFKPVRSDFDMVIGLTNDSSKMDVYEGSFLGQLIQKTSPVTIISCIFQLSMILLLYYLAVRGAIIGLRGPSATGIIVILLTIAYFCLLSGPETYARFRVPIIPLIAILGGIGIMRPKANI